MTSENLTIEYVTLPGTVSAEALAQVLAAPGGARLMVSAGQDAGGTPRTIVEIAHADSEVVAQTRQNVLKLCQQAKLRAFVV